MTADAAAPANGAAEQLGFNPDELRRKYAHERDKRLRKDGKEQYIEVTGRFAHFLNDPYVERRERAPIREEVDVAIIGGGYGGLIIAARLQMAGMDNVRIIESGGDFGGTWYWNRYPGAQCDIESYIYMPLLEETGYVPSEKYAHQPELFAHAQRIGRHFDLYKRAAFQTHVKTVQWNEKDARWTLKTDRNDEIRARFVIVSSGPLNRPKLPAVPGIENFKGHTFHTSRWDYGYTGGDSTGGLEKLADKRIGIIGTGATAVQCVPYLGRYAKHLTVFQRTPSSVDLRGNRPTDPEWAKTLEPGWQEDRNRNFVSIVTGIPQEKDLVNDGWTYIFTKLTSIIPGKASDGTSEEEMARRSEIVDFQKMNEVRARVDSCVQDQNTAEALKPWYRQWCKRPTFNDNYLPTFNRPNVSLVDTGGTGVERMTEHGAVVNGREIELDCIVFATGFEVGTDYSRRAQFEIIGRNGLKLSDYWSKGMRTYHGFSAHGFPNCFHMGFTQTGLAPNVTYMLENQAKHIVYMVKEMEARKARTVEPTEQAEAEWVAVIKQPTPFGELIRQCTPGYYNGEGKAGEGGLFENFYGGSPLVFFDEILANWRQAGKFEGMRVE
jgi:cyclohexanone monooxygenase